MTQKREPVGCMRALLKPGQEFPQPIPELQEKSIREGRVLVLPNGNQVAPEPPRP